MVMEISFDLPAPSSERNLPAFAPEVIRRLAGHSSLVVTSKYIHSDDDFMADRVREAHQKKSREDAGSESA